VVEAEQARVDEAVRQAMAEQVAFAAPPAPLPTSGGLTDQKMAQLQKLAELQKAGILTQEEFAAEKAKTLAS